MPQVLIRDLDSAVVRKLKARARRHRRSLQAELKEILEEAATMGGADIRTKVNRIREMFTGRAFSDSAVLIRRDRVR